MYEKLLSQVNNNLEKYKLSELDIKLVNKLNNDPIEFINSSATTLAKEFYTNTTYINRFSKKCGFDSFTDLKYGFINNQKTSRNIVIEESLKNKIINETDITDFFEKDFTYFLFAVGASQNSASLFQRKLLLLGYSAIVVDEFSLIENIDKKKVIIISSSGNNIVLLSIIDLIKEAGETPILALTKKESVISNNVDIVVDHGISKTGELEIDLEQQIHIIKTIDEVVKILMYSHTS